MHHLSVNIMEAWLFVLKIPLRFYLEAPVCHTNATTVFVLLANGKCYYQSGSLRYDNSLCTNFFVLQNKDVFKKRNKCETEESKKGS